MSSTCDNLFSDGPHCCGSRVQHSRTVNTGRLSRTASIGLLDVLERSSHGDEIPPSRVGDFRVQVNPAALHASFSWTAPGNQRDQGRGKKPIYHYILYCAVE